MKKLFAIIFLTLFWNGNGNAKVIKLVCTDPTDTSLPLSIQIMTDPVKMGAIGNLSTKLQVSDVQYTLSYDGGISWWVGINRMDGAFNARLKMGNGETIRWKGYCKKNVPKF
tara:strand:+ start:309 stop:644 length:336 start_codon:yes stop_codon:yes gene_type:complete